MGCANDLISLDPNCDALKKKGGIKKRVWAGLKDNLTLTVDADGNVDTVTVAALSPAAGLVTYTGKKLKHNGALTGEVGENTNTIKQDLNLVLYHYTQEQKTAIENLFNSEEVVLFVETEAGQIECWGYDTGLTASALTGGTGTALNDSTAITVTLTGSQDGLPKVCAFDTDLQGNIDYLDGLVL